MIPSQMTFKPHLKAGNAALLDTQIVYWLFYAQRNVPAVARRLIANAMRFSYLPWQFGKSRSELAK